MKRTNQLHITHATSNLGIMLDLKLVLNLQDLANPNNGLYLIPNPLQYQNIGGNFEEQTSLEFNIKINVNNIKKIK